MNQQKGAILVEYTIAAAILIPIFLVLGIALGKAIQSRGFASIKSVKQTTPISPTLSSLRKDAGFENGDLTYQDEHDSSETLE